MESVSLLIIMMAHRRPGVFCTSFYYDDSACPLHHPQSRPYSRVHSATAVHKKGMSERRSEEAKQSKEKHNDDNN